VLCEVVPGTERVIGGGGSPGLDRDLLVGRRPAALPV